MISKSNILFKSLFESTPNYFGYSASWPAFFADTYIRHYMGAESIHCGAT